MQSAWRGFPSIMSTAATNSNGSATTYTGYNDIFTVGAGQVDAWAAYNSPMPPRYQRGFSGGDASFKR